jgi:hypothetical protein
VVDVAVARADGLEVVVEADRGVDGVAGGGVAGGGVADAPVVLLDTGITFIAVPLRNASDSARAELTWVPAILRRPRFLITSRSTS